MFILTEKPSVAKDIAAALGGFSFSKENGWYQRSGKDCIIAAHGHLLELCEPEDYNPDLKKWTKETLPIIPVKMNYRKIPDSNKTLEKIRNAFRIFGQEDFVLATDAEREGELIGAIILNHVGFTEYETAKRFWVSQALSPEVVKTGLAAAKPMKEYQSYKMAGYARQHSDWLVGINITRLLSCSTGTLCSFGRVQSAVLGAIYLREKSIKNFTPEPYKEFQIKLEKDGKEFTALLSTESGTRFTVDSSFLSSATTIIKPGTTVSVKNVSRQTKHLQPPQLFNITGLQKHCSSKFNLSPDETLKIAQKLYEEYKCLSYPRTPSVVLGDDNTDLFQKVYDTLSGIYPALAIGCQIEQITIKNKRIFNSAKLTDHHALIPLAPLPNNATPTEKNVYLAVTERFFNTIKEPHTYEVVQVILNHDSYNFLASGKTVINTGWKTANAEDDKEEQQLPLLSQTQSLPIIDTTILNKLTKAKPHFTDSSILALMENPKGEDTDDTGKLTGLGTPATRAEILKKLLTHGYITYQNKNIMMTDKGNFLIETIIKIPSLANFISLKITTIWEEKLASNPKQFLSETKSFLVENIPLMKIENTWKDPTVCCPLCKTGKILTGKKQYFCSNYKTGCQFKIWNEICGAKITPTDVAALVSGKESKVKKMKNKEGKEFNAKLKLNDSKIEFVFSKSKSKKKSSVTGKKQN